MGTHQEIRVSSVPPLSSPPSGVTPTQTIHESGLMLQEDFEPVWEDEKQNFLSNRSNLTLTLSLYNVANYLPTSRRGEPSCMYVPWRSGVFVRCCRHLIARDRDPSKQGGVLIFVCTSSTRVSPVTPAYLRVLSSAVFFLVFIFSSLDTRFQIAFFPPVICRPPIYHLYAFSTLLAGHCPR